MSPFQPRLNFGVQSTQDFAPHSVATSEMNNIAEHSRRALKSRGSRTSRKMAINVSIKSLPNQEAAQQSVFIVRAIPHTHLRFPSPQGEGAPRRPRGAR